MLSNKFFTIWVIFNGLTLMRLWTQVVLPRPNGSTCTRTTHSLAEATQKQTWTHNIRTDIICMHIPKPEPAWRNQTKPQAREIYANQAIVVGPESVPRSLESTTGRRLKIEYARPLESYEQQSPVRHNHLPFVQRQISRLLASLCVRVYVSLCVRLSTCTCRWQTRRPYNKWSEKCGWLSISLFLFALLL